MISFLNSVWTGTLFSGRCKNDEERVERIDAMFRQYKAKLFPDVKDIEAEEIKDLADMNLVFVDCRDDYEKVSVIQGAVSKAEAEWGESDLPEMVVCYCTIGYRSGLFAMEISKKYPGLDVRNLAGGVVKWCQARCELVDPNGSPTKTVHVFGRSWDLVPDDYTSVF